MVDEKVGGPVKNMRGLIKLLDHVWKFPKIHFISGKASKIFTVPAQILITQTLMSNFHILECNPKTIQYQTPLIFRLLQTNFLYYKTYYLILDIYQRCKVIYYRYRTPDLKDTFDGLVSPILLHSKKTAAKLIFVWPVKVLCATAGGLRVLFCICAFSGSEHRCRVLPWLTPRHMLHLGT